MQPVSAIEQTLRTSVQQRATAFLANLYWLFWSARFISASVKGQTEHEPLGAVLQVLQKKLVTENVPGTGTVQKLKAKR